MIQRHSRANNMQQLAGVKSRIALNLPLDCLQQLSEQQVALRVPLGKLHSERLVPVDEETQRVVARIVELGALTPVPEHESQAFLLPRYWQPGTWYRALHNTLRDRAWTAGCTGRVNPHRLRPLLRDRDGAPRRQPPGAYANDRTQRHPHDLALLCADSGYVQ